MPSAKLSRRIFLASTALLGCSAEAALKAAPKEPRQPPPKPAQTPDVAAIFRDKNYLRAVKGAVQASGGLAFVRAGQQVLLKVNTNSGDAYPYSTNPTLVAYLCAELARRGAKVTVGDRSFWGDDDTRGNFEKNGIATAAREGGAKLMVFDESIAWSAIDPKLVPSWRGPVRLPRIAMTADHIINLPCVKTHFITQATLTLKNALGWVHPQDRARPGNLRNHKQSRIYRQTVEINRALTPRLNLLDGHRALVGGGPTPYSGAGPRLVDAHTIIASRDRIAADALGIALIRQWAHDDEAVMQRPVWQNPMLRAALKVRLGISGPEQLRVVSKGISKKLLKDATLA